MTFDKLLAMLSYASACPLSVLLPPGEIAPLAEQYRDQRLIVAALASVDVAKLREICTQRVMNLCWRYFICL